MNNLNNIKSIHFSGLGRMHLRNIDDYGISEFVGFVMVFLIATTAVSMLIFWGAPTMEDKKASISAESALLQFDAMNHMIDDAFGGGVSSYSSKITDFKFAGGNTNLDEKGTRFVLFYSVYDYGGSTQIANMFDFEVTGLDDTDSAFFFTLKSAKNPSPVTLEFDARNLVTRQISIASIGIAKDETKPVGFGFSLTDALRIDIFRTGPREYYGCIWLFDVGSIVFQTTAPSGIYESILENGGVISGHLGNYYLNKEPKSWPWTLLDGNSMISMRILQIRRNPSSTVSSISGTSTAEFSIKPRSSTVEASNVHLFSNFKMKIHGSRSSAWRSYYINNLGFEYNQASDFLFLRTQDGTNFLFSLNRAVCYFTMEVKK